MASQIVHKHVENAYFRISSAAEAFIVRSQTRRLLETGVKTRRIYILPASPQNRALIGGPGAY